MTSSQRNNMILTFLPVKITMAIEHSLLMTITTLVATP